MKRSLVGDSAKQRRGAMGFGAGRHCDVNESPGEKLHVRVM
jgi:hypothetical protein